MTYPYLLVVILPVQVYDLPLSFGYIIHFVLPFPVYDLPLSFGFSLTLDMTDSVLNKFLVIIGMA